MTQTAAQTRRNIRRVDSTEVQGEGSWVEIRKATWGETKRMGAEVAAHEGDQAAQVALSERLIVEHVLGWSWVGDDGIPLPLPSTAPEVLDLLTGEEVAFLAGAINGSEDRPKP